MDNNFDSNYVLLLECQINSDCNGNETCQRVDGSGVNICFDDYSIQDDDGLEIIETEFN